MFRPLKILIGTKCPPTRCCSAFVSRMRFSNLQYVNRLKEDDEACAAALQNAHIFLFHRLSPLLQRTEHRTLRPTALVCSGTEPQNHRTTEESVLIGCSEENQAQFCLDVGKNILNPGSSLSWWPETLNSVQDPSPYEPDLCFLLQGQALLRWNQTSGFCSTTGQPTHRNRAGSQRVCSSSGIIYYPKMSPVVIVLVSDGKRCLLGRQSSFPRGMYSALAGFCDMGETLEETLRREVAEEVGLEVHSVSYSSSQHWPFPHSSFMMAFHASVSPAHTQVSCQLEDARWFSLEEITSALQVKTPPRRGDPPVVWLPPKHAIGNRLITEWRSVSCLHYVNM
uniref:NAD(+) diphosphatase n=1 Tax=Dicentrarchus labrax TaxID=13489 RepID=A0A8P4FZB1_DICLA